MDVSFAGVSFIVAFDHVETSSFQDSKRAGLGDGCSFIARSSPISTSVAISVAIYDAVSLQEKTHV